MNKHKYSTRYFNKAIIMKYLEDRWFSNESSSRRVHSYVYRLGDIGVAINYKDVTIYSDCQIDDDIYSGNCIARFKINETKSLDKIRNCIATLYAEHRAKAHRRMLKNCLVVGDMNV